MNYLEVNFKRIDFTVLLIRLELNNLPAGSNRHGCGAELRDAEDEKLLRGNRDRQENLLRALRENVVGIYGVGARTGAWVLRDKHSTILSPGNSHRTART